jgi:hypothetical protein
LSGSPRCGGFLYRGESKCGSDCTGKPIALFPYRNEEDKYADQDTDYFRLCRGDPDVDVRDAGARTGRSHRFTFNQPVELPGVTLPPGTYVFRFADATSSRKVMQVMAKDSTNKTHGLFMTISAQRPRPSDAAELRFLETPAGQPTAVKTWWYPGNTIGREFIYPKSQARRLAQATNQTVLTTQADNVTNDQMQTADLAYVSPSGQETALTDDQLVEAAANTPPVGATATARSDRSASQRTAATAGTQEPRQMASARTSLPRTSSPLPLAGLFGLISLVGAAALRFRL